MSDMEIIAGIGLGVIGLALAFYVLYVIGCWKAFAKAGEPGWKSLIPVYNQYIQFRLVWNTTAFWLTLALGVASGTLQSMANNYPDAAWLTILVTLVSIAAFVVYVMLNLRIAKAYGKGTGFGIGLIVFPYIFMIILGWGNSVYAGNPEAAMQ